MFRRRTLLWLPIAGSVSLLGGCDQSGLPSRPVPLEQAQAYVSDLVGALSAGARGFLRGPPDPSLRGREIVTQNVANIQAVNVKIQAAVSSPEVQTDIRLLLNLINQIFPLIEPFFGPAGESVALAISVLNSFAQNLPPPPNAPVHPPKELRLMALHYHHH